MTRIRLVIIIFAAILVIVTFYFLATAEVP